jgi:hypothetical protein
MTSVYVRLEDEKVERLDALVDELSAAARGIALSRSDVLRLVIDRGLMALDSEQKKRK